MLSHLLLEVCPVPGNPPQWELLLLVKEQLRRAVEDCKVAAPQFVQKLPRPENWTLPRYFHEPCLTPPLHLESLLSKALATPMRTSHRQMRQQNSDSKVDSRVLAQLLAGDTTVVSQLARQNSTSSRTAAAAARQLALKQTAVALRPAAPLPVPQQVPASAAPPLQSFAPPAQPADPVPQPGPAFLAPPLQSLAAPAQTADPRLPLSAFTAPSLQSFTAPTQPADHAHQLDPVLQAPPVQSLAAPAQPLPALQAPPEQSLAVLPQQPAPPKLDLGQGAAACRAAAGAGLSVAAQLKQEVASKQGAGPGSLLSTALLLKHNVEEAKQDVSSEVLSTNKGKRRLRGKQATQTGPGKPALVAPSGKAKAAAKKKLKPPTSKDSRKAAASTRPKKFKDQLKGLTDADRLRLRPSGCPKCRRRWGPVAVKNRR